MDKNKKSKKIIDLIKWATFYLKKRGVDTPRLTAELLAEKITGKSRLALYLNPNFCLTGKELEEFEKKVRERGRRIPLAYLVGESYFMGYKFLTPPGVYIPRPETEILVEEALASIKRLKSSYCETLRVVDVGTGSGNIAISLAKEVENATFYATDVSSFALKVAKENARLNKVAHRIHFLLGDLFSPLKGKNLEEKIDLVVSNPPYIETGRIRFLPPEVRKEPRFALEGGKDGLYFYRKIIPEALLWLKSGGYLLLEIGYDQALKVKKIIMEKEKYWNNFKIIPDLDKNPRVIVARKK